MLVEAFSQLLGSEDQGRHVLRHQVQHFPLRAVQVSSTDKHDPLLRAAFRFFDRHQPRRLPVPEVQTVERGQVLFLHLSQRLPAGRLAKAVDLGAALHDFGKVQSVGRQFAVYAAQHFAQREPCQPIIRAGQLDDHLDVPRIGLAEGLVPGQLLHQGIGKGPFGFVQQLRQFAGRDDPRRAERQLPPLGLGDEDLQQPSARAATGQGQHDLFEVQLSGGGKLFEQVVDGGRQGRSFPIQEHALDVHPNTPQSYHCNGMLGREKPAGTSAVNEQRNANNRSSVVIGVPFDCHSAHCHSATWTVTNPFASMELLLLFGSDPSGVEIGNAS